MNAHQKYNRLKNLGAFIDSYQIYMIRINAHIEIYHKFNMCAPDFEFKINIVNYNLYNADFDSNRIDLWVSDEVSDEINYMDELD
jgi:hypothetical protein